MKVKLSKVQWEEIGKKGGWMRTAQEQMPEAKSPRSIASDPNTDQSTLMDMAKDPATTRDVLSILLRSPYSSPQVKHAVLSNPSYNQ